MRADFFSLLKVFLQTHSIEPYNTGHMRGCSFVEDGNMVFWKDVDTVISIKFHRDGTFLMEYEDKNGLRKYARGEWKEEMIG